MRKDLQRRVLGQVSSSTGPEMPVHSFHGLVCWHLWRQKAKVHKMGAAVGMQLSARQLMWESKYSLSLGHWLLLVLVGYRQVVTWWGQDRWCLQPIGLSIGLSSHPIRAPRGECSPWSEGQQIGSGTPPWAYQDEVISCGMRGLTDHREDRCGSCRKNAAGCAVVERVRRESIRCK